MACGLLAWACVGGSAAGGVTLVSDDGDLRRALRDAAAGDTVLVAPGVYRGGLNWSPRGKPGLPVTLAADDPDDPPVFRGGSEGIKLTRPAHAVLRDLIFEKAGDNGLNADDGGRRGEPAGPLELRRVVVRDTGRGGNNDGFKLSGVNDLQMIDCAAARWGGGGQGVDLVGCHRALVRGCKVDGGGRCKVGLQAKGGSRDVLFADCRVEGVTERCVNLGGLTGERFFRPAGATAEAADVRVVGCELVGASAAVAFVGSDGGRVENCVLYRQKRYPVRILRENDADRMAPTRGGAFVGNTIVWHDGDLLTFVNVGAGTEPESFVFADNVWFCATHPARSAPTGLPVEETGGVSGVDPELKDPPGDLTPTRRASDLHKEAAVRAGRHRFAVTAAALAAPFLIGLLWWGHRAAARAVRPRPVLGAERFVPPPPRAAHAAAGLAGWAGLMAAASLAPFTPGGGGWWSADWAGAVREFTARPFDAAAVSNVDWTANALAGLPLGFLAVAVVGLGNRRRSAGVRAAALSLAVIAAVAGAAIWASVLETAQLLLDGRTSTKHDVYAQTCGAAFGAAAWFLAGSAVAGRLRRAVGEVRAAQPVDFAAGITAGLVLVWVLRPFDPLVHPVDLYHKFQGGGFRPVPLGPGWSGEDLLWSSLRGVPVGVAAAVLWTSPDRPVRRFRPALVAGLAVIAAAEAAQFFVRGRVCDVTDVLAGGVGAAGGVASARLMARSPFLTPVPMDGRGLNLARRGVGAAAAGAAAVGYASAAGWLG